jgi:hypothetical protein
VGRRLVLKNELEVAGEKVLEFSIRTAAMSRVGILRQKLAGDLRHRCGDESCLTFRPDAAGALTNEEIVPNLIRGEHAV